MERVSQLREQSRISRAVRRSRTFRARIQRRRRRNALLVAGAVVAIALGAELGVASFGGMSVAEAATNGAKSLMELLDQRSPGERTAGELTKTKGERVLAERERPTVLPKNLAEVLAPPTPELATVDVVAPAAELPPVVPPPPGAILLPPPGGVIVPPPGGGVVVPPGGGDTPPGGGDTPPGGGDTPPGGGDNPPPPALPEPGTWLTMILGFGLAGGMLRRTRRVLALN